MNRNTGPSAGVAQRHSYQQGVSNYLSLTTKLAEEFSSFLTFLGIYEGS